MPLLVWNSGFAPYFFDFDFLLLYFIFFWAFRFCPWPLLFFFFLAAPSFASSSSFHSFVLFCDFSLSWPVAISLSFIFLWFFLICFSSFVAPAVELRCQEGWCRIEGDMRQRRESRKLGFAATGRLQRRRRWARGGEEIGDRFESRGASRPGLKGFLVCLQVMVFGFLVSGVVWAWLGRNCLVALCDCRW
jgi:hypothetical protein